MSVTPYPVMVPLEQQLYGKTIPDVEARTREELRRAGLKDAVKPGGRIAITAGSRGITNLAEVLRGVAREVEAVGGKPFLVPAMGSHGGATAEGQVELLETLGVTEDSIGVPILSRMETETLGETRDGHQVYIDHNAISADGIIAVNRIKPHTDFRGKTESGLTKMMAIGLGKRAQAEVVHAMGSRGLRDVIPQVAEAMMERAPIVMGVGIMENGYGHASDVIALRPDGLREAEMRLLVAAKRHASRIPFDEIDILIVDWIGKEISGAGLDTNVIGRLRMGTEPWVRRPKIQTILVLDLTENSHGNAAGTGLADLMTQRILDKMDRHVTLTNLMVSTFVERGMIPPTYQTDRDAFETAMYLHRDRGLDRLRVVRIPSTLHLEKMWVSESLLEPGVPRRCSVAGEARPMTFGEDGRVEGGYFNGETPHH
ncbi:MAG: DUF2088 domain-containing protein [Armatimonadetes bacterium]|nr:DUF2088 domain-containing protein [Armatimonadota bacterium]